MGEGGPAPRHREGAAVAPNALGGSASWLRMYCDTGRSPATPRQFQPAVQHIQPLEEPQRRRNVPLPRQRGASSPVEVAQQMPGLALPARTKRDAFSRAHMVVSATRRTSIAVRPGRAPAACGVPCVRPPGPASPTASAAHVARPHNAALQISGACRPTSLAGSAFAGNHWRRFPARRSMSIFCRSPSAPGWMSLLQFALCRCIVRLPPPACRRPGLVRSAPR